MTWLCRALPKSTHGTAGRDHGRAGEASPPQNGIEVAGDQLGHEQEQAAEAGTEVPRVEVELADVGDSGLGRACAGWAFLIETAGQAGETLLLEDVVDSDGTEGVALVFQGSADVIDGQVLFAEGDDTLAQFVLRRGGVLLLMRGTEEGMLRVLAELVDQRAETACGVAKALGGFLGGDPLHEVSPQGFVLTMGSVAGLQEEARECQFLF
jgi:hypothetical protein